MPTYSEVYTREQLISLEASLGCTDVVYADRVARRQSGVTLMSEDEQRFWMGETFAEKEARERRLLDGARQARRDVRRALGWE